MGPVKSPMRKVTSWPSFWNWAILRMSTPWPRCRSGAVGSKPALIRRGRPSLSFASSWSSLWQVTVPFVSRARASDTDPEAAVMLESWRKTRGGSMRRSADVHFQHASRAPVSGFPGALEGDVDGPARLRAPAHLHLAAEVMVDAEALMLHQVRRKVRGGGQVLLPLGRGLEEVGFGGPGLRQAGVPRIEGATALGRAELIHHAAEVLPVRADLLQGEPHDLVLEACGVLLGLVRHVGDAAHASDQSHQEGDAAAEGDLAPERQARLEGDAVSAVVPG